MNTPYRFGRFELNPTTRQFLVEGLPVALGARALDVLLALVERRERLVTKEELLELAWPGLVVEENNLQVQISALRKILGAEAIATIPGLGYRFTVPLGANGAGPAAASTASPHGLPEQRTRFIGRERELTELRSMLAGGARLVTVTGAGGSGKTRLALQVAAGLVDSVRGGVVFVPLAPVQEPALVAATIALAAGVRELKELRDRDALLVLDPSLLLERLAHSLPLLTGGTRDAPERQQTLRATIGWSYALLEEPLQRAFHRLAVFPGSFSLEAAEVVARTDLDQVTALVDWSLLKPVGEGRFLMLETIREFGRERIEGSSERDEIRDRHLGFFLQLVEQAEPKLTGPEQRQWYDRLVVENDNLREALAYACESRDGERALMLAGTIWRFWWNRGRIAEASLWYERAFAVGQNASPTARARGLFGMAHMVDAGGDFERSRALFEEAADVLRQIGDTRWLVLALTHLAGTYICLGDTLRAAAINDEALDLADRSGDARGAAVVRSNLGYMLMSVDDRRAGPLIERALEGYRSVGDTYGIASCLGNLAVIDLHGGETEAAAAKLRESLGLSSSIGDAHTLTWSLAAAAAVALARGDPDAGARLGGAVSKACSTLGLALEPIDARLMTDTTAKLRELLRGSFDDAWTAGANMDLAAAVD
ncbi:MAG: hypothetical protein E6H54_04545, partial [Betaproteobacteria bacterium]